MNSYHGPLPLQQFKSSYADVLQQHNNNQLPNLSQLEQNNNKSFLDQVVNSNSPFNPSLLPSQASSQSFTPQAASYPTRPSSSENDSLQLLAQASTAVSSPTPIAHNEWNASQKYTSLSRNRASLIQYPTSTMEPLEKLSVAASINQNELISQQSPQFNNVSNQPSQPLRPNAMMARTMYGMNSMTQAQLFTNASGTMYTTNPAPNMNMNTMSPSFNQTNTNMNLNNMNTNINPNLSNINNNFITPMTPMTPMTPNQFLSNTSNPNLLLSNTSTQLSNPSNIFNPSLLPNLSNTNISSNTITHLIDPSLLDTGEKMESKMDMKPEMKGNIPTPIPLSSQSSAFNKPAGHHQRMNSINNLPNLSTMQNIQSLPSLPSTPFNPAFNPTLLSSLNSSTSLPSISTLPLPPNIHHPVDSSISAAAQVMATAAQVAAKISKDGLLPNIPATPTPTTTLIDLPLDNNKKKRKKSSSEEIEPNEEDEELKQQRLLNPMNKPKRTHKKVQQAVQVVSGENRGSWGIGVARIYYDFINAQGNPEKYVVRLITATNLADGKSMRFVHGPDVAGRVIRLSNISRLLGQYKSPDEKMKMNVPSSHCPNTGQPSNVLTEIGLKRLIEQQINHRDIIYAKWLELECIPFLRGEKVPVMEQSNIMTNITTMG